MADERLASTSVVSAMQVTRRNHRKILIPTWYLKGICCADSQGQ